MARPVPSMDAFKKMAADLGLPMEGDDLANMYEGYQGLLKLMATLPENPALVDEPTVVFAPHGTKVTR